MIEIIVVLIIITILAPIVVSRFSTDNTSLIAQTEILKAHLRYAQIRAMSDTTTWRINLVDSATYTLSKAVGTAPNLPGDNGTTHTLTDNVTVASGVGTAITFNEWGSPGDVSGVPLTANAVINLSQGGQSSTITITKNTGYIP
jgi:MSHA pilin protein MshC